MDDGSAEVAELLIDRLNHRVYRRRQVIPGDHDAFAAVIRKIAHHEVQPAFRYRHLFAIRSIGKAQPGGQ